MTRALAVVTPGADTDPAALCARLGALTEPVPAIERSQAGVHPQGVVAPIGMGAGAITWELTIATGAGAPDLDAVLADPVVVACLGPGTAIATAVTLDPIAARITETEPPLVKRTLLLRVLPEAPPEAVRQFELDLAEMPEHIHTIRSWRLSHTGGSAWWTHAWEQEFASLDGLRGEYMLHPFHRVTVDAWFDPEVPDHIVAVELAHLFTESPVAVLA